MVLANGVVTVALVAVASVAMLLPVTAVRTEAVAVLVLMVLAPVREPLPKNLVRITELSTQVAVAVPVAVSAMAVKVAVAMVREAPIGAVRLLVLPIPEAEAVAVSLALALVVVLVSLSFETRGGNAMAKNMARLRAGIVVNIEWLPDRAAETETLKEMGDIPVAVGDSWGGGKFYRNGEVLVSPVEDMENALAILMGGKSI